MYVKTRHRRQADGNRTDTSRNKITDWFLQATQGGPLRGAGSIFTVETTLNELVFAVRFQFTREAHVEAMLTTFLILTKQTV